MQNTQAENRTAVVPRNDARSAICDLVYETDVCLDIGPGIQPQRYTRPKVHLCVEAHAPYVDQLQSMLGSDPRYVFLRGTWQQVLRLLPDQSVDTAFANDLIEHLEKADGVALLHELQRLARHQIVIFTPLGFYPQSYEAGETDAWGMDGTEWQTHRSGWMPDDFLALGPNWHVLVSPDFHLVDHHQQPLETPFGALWAVYTRSPMPDHITVTERQARENGRLGKLPPVIRDPLRKILRTVRRYRGERGPFGVAPNVVCWAL